MLHDLDVAVDFDGKIGLHAEDDVETAGILAVQLYAVDAATLGPPA